MTDQRLSPLRGPGLIASRRVLLDAIRHALKHRQIDFFTATELSDMVKAGRLNEVLKALEYQADEPN